MDRRARSSLPRQVAVALALCALSLAIATCRPKPAPPAPARPVPADAPRLVLFLVADQLTADYLVRFRPLLQHGIHLGQQAEMLTDGLRALLLEAAGYDTQVFEFISLEHTNKNKMILAVRRAQGAEIADSAAEAQEVEAEEGAEAVDLSPERYAELGAREQFVLTVSERGFGKRSSSYEYRISGRGGKGITAMIVNERNGRLVASFPVEDSDQIMLVTDGGKLIRCPVDDVRIAGRKVQGVRIFKTEDGEKVVSVERIPEDANGEPAGENGNGQG